MPGIIVAEKGVGHSLWVEQVRGRTRVRDAGGENNVLAGRGMGDGVSKGCSIVKGGDIGGTDGVGDAQETLLGSGKLGP
jgi:hypothetical protein